MNTNIDGQTFREMCISGANALDNSKEEINNLNVFPVPDGDTGINMSLTMSHVEDVDASNGNISECADNISSVVLRSARGNSGAILALFFRGLAKSFGGAVAAGTKEFAAAFRRGTEEAYKAVMNPTEGTILTVMRECAEDAEEQSKKPGFTEDVTEFFSRVIRKAEEALAKTPELLPVLKQANVVDAGGSGFVTMLKGMYAALKNEPVVRLDVRNGTRSSSADFSEFATEDIKFAYCTECIIDKFAEFYGEGTARAFYETVAPLGDSAVFIDDERIIKLHIHTNNPGVVIETALGYGALASVKIENMRMQHSEMAFEGAPEPTEPKPFGFVSVCIGDGIENVFRDMGVDVIVKGGQTMNPSTQDILDAVNKTNAETVFILPNNKNIDMVAKQAAALLEGSEKKAVVLSTRTVPQGIATLIAFNPDATVDENVEAMTEAYGAVRTVSVTHAVRDAVINNVNITKGQKLGLVDGKIRMVADSANDCIKYLADYIKNGSYITVFHGEGVSERRVEKLEKTLRKIAPDAEIVFIYGGQPLYDYIISIE